MKAVMLSLRPVLVLRPFFWGLGLSQSGLGFGLGRS